MTEVADMSLKAVAEGYLAASDAYEDLEETTKEQRNKLNKELRAKRTELSQARKAIILRMQEASYEALMVGRVLFTLHTSYSGDNSWIETSEVISLD